MSEEGSVKGCQKKTSEVSEEGSSEVSDEGPVSLSDGGCGQDGGLNLVKG